jgi:hypothetical protein
MVATQMLKVQKFNSWIGITETINTMNVTDFTHLINNPFHSGATNTRFRLIIDEFPYFQSARAFQLKGLYNQDSYKYMQFN